MTSPYAWYQYFLNVPDADVMRCLKLLTFLGADEIGELETATRTARCPGSAASSGSELTDLVHGPSSTRSWPRARPFSAGRSAELDAATLDAAMARSRG